MKKRTVVIRAEYLYCGKRFILNSITYNGSALRRYTSCNTKKSVTKKAIKNKRTVPNRQELGGLAYAGHGCYSRYWSAGLPGVS